MSLTAFHTLLMILTVILTNVIFLYYVIKYVNKTTIFQVTYAHSYKTVHW